jgi:hypothetical protein
MNLHRGRIQAQGGGLEKSVAWSQATPPTVTKGLAMINELISQLSSAEYRIRANAFEDARKFVIRTADNNGVDSLIKKSFRVKGTQDIRVDIEIIKGKAFIADSPDIQSN